jgi:Transposase DDE domain group 1
MTQGILPFKYENDKQKSEMTGFGGLPVYLDLAQAAGLSKAIDRYLKASSDSQGWTDRQVVMSLILLNLSGGDCVEDINRLESDEGLCRIIKRAQKHGMTRKQRRAFSRRWRKGEQRTVPSQSAVFRYLSLFHNREQDEMRETGKAFIPAANEHLRGFAKTNRDFLAFAQKHNMQRTATLDMDATLVETNKMEALYCYKGFKSYQPLNTWWAEQELIVHTEFRDGNVPAGYDQLRVFKEALKCLPEGIKKVRLRSDTAGYQHNLLKYCAMGKNKRFGKIEFGIGCDVTPEFKKVVSEVPDSEWTPLTRGVNGAEVKACREWAEVCFVPNAIGHSKKGPEYRYIATREVMGEQLIIPGTIEEREAPFPTMSMESKKYKVFGIVTNMDWDGQELIPWLYKRCGKSEEAHSIMKDDLAGGKLPSEDFGVNAAWWWIMIMALNLNGVMKRLVLGKAWISKRMKAIRFHLINIPARVMERSRELFVRLPKNHPCLDWFITIRARIALFTLASPG